MTTPATFSRDPVTAAVAVGWSGMDARPMKLKTDISDGFLSYSRSDSGRQVTVATSIDAELFGAAWLDAVRRPDAA